jgi:ubiquinone biosynthesis accessory factor UbiK
MNKHFAESAFARLQSFLAQGPAKDLEELLKSSIRSALARLNLVTREEFELQNANLGQTLDRLAALETRINELEIRASAHKPQSDSE